MGLSSVAWLGGGPSALAVVEHIRCSQEVLRQWHFFCCVSCSRIMDVKCSSDCEVNVLTQCFNVRVFACTSKVAEL